MKSGAAAPAAPALCRLQTAGRISAQGIQCLPESHQRATTGPDKPPRVQLSLPKREKRLFQVSGGGCECSPIARGRSVLSTLVLWPSADIQTKLMPAPHPGIRPGGSWRFPAAEDILQMIPPSPVTKLHNDCKKNLEKLRGALKKLIKSLMSSASREDSC